jgi:FAD synthase
MKASLSSTPARPVAAVIGSWDPLVPPHLSLFRKLRDHAARYSLCSLVIILHPPPHRLLHGGSDWVDYEHLDATIAAVLASGIDAAMIVNFKARDVNAGAAAFFDVVAEHVQLRELWLGAQQSLGRGPDGSAATVLELAKQRDFSVERLPGWPEARAGDQVIQLLQKGRLQPAIAFMGRYPAWPRPSRAALRLNWQPGLYLAASIGGPGCLPGADRFEAELVAREGASGVLEWPSRRVKWLALLAGPGDAAKAS